ncbi:MAG: hypothetical protein J6W52_13410, partial [Bacteroidaceae bacterium]|nr:hypothetical protein [Bacteroidaceae bacterium]
VSIYAGEGKGTLSNNEGEFKLVADEGDMVSFRCIGYNIQTVSARQMPGTIRLKPYTTSLREVTVQADDKDKIQYQAIDKILRRTIDNLAQDYKNHNNWVRRYFFRTLTEMDGGAYITEAFMIARSVVNLRSALITSGLQGCDTEEYGGTLDMAYNNIHQLIEVAPMTNESDSWKSAIKPLSDLPTLHKYYDIQIRHMRSEDGRQLFKIEFTWKKNLPTEDNYLRNITGTAYVDAETCRLLRFDGLCNNYTMSTDISSWYSYATTIKFQLEYDYSQGAASVSHLVIHGDNERSIYHALLWAMDNEEKQIEYTRNSAGNIVTAIRNAGYDANLWKKYDIVKRTREEERAVFGRVKSLQKISDAATTVDTIQTENAELRTLWHRLWLSSKRYAQEKVFVHMDNTSYCLGDTIWFAAYTRDTDDKMPSLQSSVLYVELLNHEGFLVERKQIEMVEGYGSGFFSTNKEGLYSGFYELRAYTRWQLNWGFHERKHSRAFANMFVNKEKEQAFFRDYDKLYSRVFPVYDKPLEMEDDNRIMTLRPLIGQRKIPEKRKLNVHFYPEGGHLINGMNTQVAFEATWDDGEYAEGTLYFGDKTIKTTNRGRGRFLVTPETYTREPLTFATNDGTMAETKLPEPENSGVAIHAEENGEEWNLVVMITDNIIPQNLGLSVMNEGKISHFRQIKKHSTRFKIPYSSLQPGVNQATVFDNQGQVLADRMFFVWKDKIMQPTLKIEGLHNKYQPYEKVELQISCPLADSAAFMYPYYFSLAVRDKERMEHTYDNANILTEMLLASEIRGFVPNATWYFQQNDAEHRDALDLLLMVQGWRRFSWSDMATNKTWHPSQPKETAVTLYGKICDLPQYQQDENDTTDFNWVLHTEAIDPSFKSSTHMYNNLDKDGHFSVLLPHQPYSPLRYNIIFMDVLKKESDYYIAETKDRNPAEFLNKKSFLLPKIPTKQKNTMETGKTDQPEYRVSLDKPFPRFAQPYNFYQQHIPKRHIKQEQFSQIGFRDDCPSLMMNVGEHIYDLDDAGLSLSPGLNSKEALALLSLGDFCNNITIRRGINRFRRRTEKMQRIPSDSIYAPKYLKSYPCSTYLNDYELEEYEGEGSIENYVLYTDANLRDTTRSAPLTIVEYPYPDGYKRTMPSSRTFIVPGLDQRIEFYHPNYKYMPENEKDHRHTLYWAPCLKLNKKGKTHVIFYNNSRTTHLSVEAEGQATDGTLLWSKTQ